MTTAYRIWEMMERSKTGPHIEEDDFYIIHKPLSPLEKFWQKVAEAKVMIEEDQEEWDFMIKDFVDAAVFAYYDLSKSDRLAIVH